MRLISLLIGRIELAAEDGFTMIVAIATMVIVMSLSVAAFAAINGDLPLTANDSLQKQAYAAAQAGVQSYLFALDQDSEYWTQCVPSPLPGAINLAGSTANTGKVPGSSNETYAIELLPAAGQAQYTQCSKTNPVSSMIQAAGNGAGTLRIRSTGFAGTVTRTLVASLREQSFLDYAWFTNYETSDPIVQVANAYLSSNPQDNTIEPPDLCALNPSIGCGSNYDAAIAGAAAQCGQYRYPPPAGSTSTVGYDRYAAAFYESYMCDQISFITADHINGPFHTNDQAQLCGTPTFGRTPADSVEFGYSPGYVQGCSGNPIIGGSLIAPASILKPPPSNASLKSLATLTFTGTTCISLSPNSTSGVSVAQPNATYPSCFSSGIPWTAYSYPSNGVLYVKNGACSLTYDVDNPSYTGNTGCGTVYVQGSDGPPLTIAAENDIVIDGNLTYSGSSSLVGLIANNFVRVYHPVDRQPLQTNSAACSTSSSNGPDPLSNGVTIDAMLLSLQHSFIVDQYNCGNGNLGTLTVTGGIAQNFRGPVGTDSNGQVSTGYAKSYTYDDRLRYEEPPHFIDPVQGSWSVQRQNECTPNSSNPC